MSNFICSAVSKISANGFAGSIKRLHAGIHHGDFLLLRISLDVGPTTAQIGVVTESEQFQHHGPAKFSHSLAPPVLPQFFQGAVAVIGGVNQLVHPG